MYTVAQSRERFGSTTTALMASGARNKFAAIFSGEMIFIATLE